MQEPTMTRAIGSDVTQSGWQTASGRPEAPRPDAVRTAAVPGGPPAPGTPDTLDIAANTEHASTARSSRDAAFPTSYARFAINPDTQKLSIKIVDAVTDEVIREIPPEQVQRIAEDLQSLARRSSIGRKPAGIEGVAGGGVDRYV